MCRRHNTAGSYGRIHDEEHAITTVPAPAQPHIMPRFVNNVLCHSRAVNRCIESSNESSLIQKLTRLCTAISLTNTMQYQTAELQWPGAP